MPPSHTGDARVPPPTHPPTHPGPGIRRAGDHLDGVCALAGWPQRSSMVSKLTGRGACNWQREGVLTGAAAAPAWRALQRPGARTSEPYALIFRLTRTSRYPHLKFHSGQRKNCLEEPGDVNAAVRWQGRSGRLSGLRGSLRCAPRVPGPGSRPGRGETALGGLDAVACKRWTTGRAEHGPGRHVKDSGVSTGKFGGG